MKERNGMSTTTLRRPAAKPARARILTDAIRPMMEFHTNSTWARRQHEPGISDFTFGNPHDMPLTGVVDALQRWTTPENESWFAYKTSEPEAQEVVARSLQQRYGIPFDAADIAMTTGGFGALAAGLRAVTDPGDEVIYCLPAWPAYETMIRAAGCVPVKVQVDPYSFDLDVDAIANAITERTRIVIVNTPHNPTGKVYSPGTLMELAALLEGYSIRNRAPIFILSDEPYREIVFDGIEPVTPARYYSRTLIAYSYGKVLLAPGQRIGYLAMTPSMPDREQLREDIFIIQLASGWTFPNAVLQHAIADLDRLSIDMSHMQARRDRFINALREYGYEVARPDGTFYLYPKLPMASESDFFNYLAGRDVFVMPGSIFEHRGHFRISLTASDEMIDRSLPIFEEAMQFAWDTTVVNDILNDG
jgi:aspartate aminotransferase